MNTNYNYKYAGAVFQHTATGAISTGDVVKMGQILGVARVNLASGETGSVATQGVFDVPKVDAAVITQGESLTWDSSVSKFDDNAASPATGDVTGPPAVAAESKGATTDATIKVLFTGVPGTVA